jgi:pimeloyl-ACP methyl ester carboxylesterase
MMKPLWTLLAALTLGVTTHLLAEGEPRLENYAYPFPVKLFKFSSQQQDLEMAYMDLAPTGSPAGAIVLLHGKNFSGAYWKETAEALRDAGYRVIMPDQIGFGKSSKPAHYQFTFQQLAQNTHALLEGAGIKKAYVLGHSMGGMIGTRYTLMFPESTAALLLIDPLGLEDWKAKGVPYTSVDAAYLQELKQTPEKIRAYQKENYYHGEWKPSYERGVEMLTHFLQSPDYGGMAWNQALTSEMIYTQPVVYEFPLLRVPTLLLVGELDRTAPGKNLAPEQRRNELGDYPALAKAAAAVIPQCTLVTIPAIGHLPQVEAFPRFIEELKTFLAAQQK